MNTGNIVGPTAVDDRVLVCAPLPRDVALTCRFLEGERIQATPCLTPQTLCAKLIEGAAAAVVDEHAIHPPMAGMVAEALSKQPSWSDIPIIVVAEDVNAMDPVLEALGPIATVLVLERPMRRRTVVSIVMTSLRARRRQYHSRDLLVLAEADRRKNEFLATLGHELRNPLAAIQSAHALIQRIGPSNPQCERPHAVIDRQIANLSRMVDDLLDVSRIVSGKLSLDQKPVDLNKIVEHAVSVCESKTRPRGQVVSIALSPEPAIVLGDAVRLEQMVTNLLDNAAKYTPAKGHIWVWVQANGQVRIGVRDDGDGIAPAMLPHVFEPFIQEPTSMARSQGGLGLGLPLVKGIATLHGGSVAAASDGVGRGSTFVLTLPKAAGEEAERHSTQVVKSPEDTVLSGRHVLLVDDNADLIEMLKILLEQHGCRVDVAHDGQEGVDQALLRQPEVALIDIGLPSLNGYEVAAKIRAALGRKPLLIAVSGYGQLEDRRKALEAGFDEHLVKPVETRQMGRVLLRSQRWPTPPG